MQICYHSNSKYYYILCFRFFH